MNDNQITKSEPKYRKQLNKEQLAILDVLYRFRFASSEQIAIYSGKKTSKHVQKRLKILEDQAYIAKGYDKTYKLRGRPAAYYLLPKGAQILAKWSDRSPNELINVRAIYKDKTVSESFITHCLHILGVYLQLRTFYGNELEFFTKSDLKHEQYNYYPQPLPDAHIRIPASKGSK